MSTRNPIVRSPIATDRCQSLLDAMKEYQRQNSDLQAKVNRYAVAEGEYKGEIGRLERRIRDVEKKSESSHETSEKLSAMVQSLTDDNAWLQKLADKLGQDLTKERSQAQEAGDREVRGLGVDRNDFFFFQFFSHAVLKHFRVHFIFSISWKSDDHLCRLQKSAEILFRNSTTTKNYIPSILTPPPPTSLPQKAKLRYAVEALRSEMGRAVGAFEGELEDLRNAFGAERRGLEGRLREAAEQNAEYREVSCRIFSYILFVFTFDPLISLACYWINFLLREGFFFVWFGST